MKHLFILSISLSFLLAGCKDQNGAIQLDEEFSIEFEQKAHLDLDALTIEFESIVEDSRCPLGSMCAWAGQVIVTAKLDDLTSRTLSLNEGQTITEYKGFIIALLSVNPYPSGSKGADHKEYSIDLVVSEL